MDFTVTDGRIRNEKGIPTGQRWFADNRLAIQFDETGVTRVEYRNPRQKEGNPMVFLKGLHDGFRYYLEDEGVTLAASYENNTVWPFGIDSQWRYGSVTLQHSVYTIGDSIIVRMVTPGHVPEGLRFKLEFNEAFAFIPSEQSNFLYSEMGARRTWEDWAFDTSAGILAGKYVERLKETRDHDPADLRINDIDLGALDEPAVLHVIIGADFPIEHVQRSGKHILYSGCLEPNRVYTFVTSLLPGCGDAADRFLCEVQNAQENIRRQFDRYEAVIRRSPRLSSPYERLNDFVSLAPLYYEAMKVTEHPGAVRGKTSNYWVWGWDGLTSNRAALYWGDGPFIRKLLRFYEETAHPQKGIAHCYRNDLIVASVSELPAQGMYIALLHHYYNCTHDMDAVRERYRFAKKTYRRIAATEVEGTGFCEATSLFPDFPVYMKETGHDISAFNNTVFYCASRSMEFLASLVGDSEMSREAESVFRKMERNFVQLFFDRDKGFIVNSIDAKTLARRACYSSDAVKWENEYCQDLMENINSSCMDFFAKHFVCKAGIRPMPVWDSAFDGDANQLHSWWPVMGEYFAKLINENNRLDLVDQWIGWVSYWTGHLTIPEGIPCYIDTAEPELDRWDTLCGTWHGYSIRGWYQDVVHSIVGVGADAGGLTFYPYEGAEMNLTGLHYMGKIIDIAMLGSGRYIESIDVDGTVVRGTCKLPADLLGSDHIRIKVKRVKENPHKAYIKSATGITLTGYRFDTGRLSATVQGYGTCRIKMIAPAGLSVRLNGEAMDVRYDPSTGLAIVEAKMTVATMDMKVIF